MEQEKNELLATIKQNYTGAHEMNIENSVAFTANIRATLEAAVKLFWKEKLGYIPSWTRGSKEIFITGQAVRSQKFTAFFERWALKEMEYICDACGDSVHGENMSIDTANELIGSLDKSLRAMEKLLGFLIIPAIKKEEVIKLPNPTPKPIKQQEPREKVKHARFGEGEILSIKNDIVKVVFGGMNIKEFPYPSSLNNGILTRIKISTSQPTVNTPSIQATTSSQKHRWTYDEDRTCCRIFIETYIINRTYCPFDTLATKILTIYPNMKFSSVKMKLQNIKRICLDYGVKDSSTISPLDNYSAQNLRAMKESLQEIGITI